MDRDKKWQEFDLILNTKDFDDVSNKLNTELINTNTKDKLFVIGIDYNMKSDFGKILLIDHTLLNPIEIYNETDPNLIVGNIANTIREFGISTKELAEQIKKISIVGRNTFKIIEEKPKNKRYDVIPNNFYKKRW